MAITDKKVYCDSSKKYTLRHLVRMGGELIKDSGQWAILIHEPMERSLGCVYIFSRVGRGSGRKWKLRGVGAVAHSCGDIRKHFIKKGIIS